MRRLAVTALCTALACGGSGSPTKHSHAADAIIDRAATPEEQAELKRVRDEIDAAAQKRIAEIDAEIAKLERENAELRKRSTN